MGLQSGGLARCTGELLFICFLIISFSKNSYQRLQHVRHKGENSEQSPCPGEADVLVGESEKEQINQDVDTSTGNGGKRGHS